MDTDAGFGALRPLRLAALYAILGLLWILFSDTLLNSLIQDRGAVAQLQLVKGAVYVLGTAALLYFLLRSSLRRYRKVERARSESQRRFDTLLSNLPGMVYRCRNDRDWTMEFVSEGARQLTGFAGRELVERPPGVPAYGELIHPEDRERVWEGVQEAIAERRPFRLTYRIEDRSGAERWVWEQGRGVFEDGELAALEGFIVDITERRRLERQLMRAQKMESLGRLASGVAHDFNNLLTAIGGYSEMLLESLEPGDTDRRGDVEEIRRATGRAAELTRQLLTFARREPSNPRPLEIDTVVREAQRLLHRLLPENIELVTELGADGATVRADPAQLEQVIVNLAVNARDAMSEGGRLELTTRAVSFTRGFGTRSGLELGPGAYVVLEVRDSGVGMTADVRRQIFEPFFTTKGPGRGTGLGLAIVYGVVTGSGGEIAVDTVPGRGTTFRIYLPEYERTTARAG